MRLFACLLITFSALAQTFENVTVKEVNASAGVTHAIATLPRGETVWAAWTVPTAGRSVRCDRCRLDGQNNNVSVSEDREVPFATRLVLVARLGEGTLRRVHFFSASCPIEGRGETVYLLTNAAPESSIDYLRASLNDAEKESSVIAALAMHEHAAALRALIDLARHDRRTKVRRDALFWLGERAGERAAAELRRAADEDPDDDVKEHAVFAISQLPRDRAVPLLIELVKTHKSRALRKRAMFWLAQTDDPRALETIEEILTR